ncbi:hypothetical protein [Klebsiella pneumoniae]|uniref:hypothetical protein n=1 Tax=Klebsiella pneumoniae TaxID=573 RepID=UPI0027D32254|nr:hypothetical protein [Klebsiella pneumoniae]
MTTYKTGNPLGSSAVKDLFDNAENLDHFENDRSNETWENRFGVPGKTRYGMEQEHDRQISSQEARFQQFLLSSGYVFLGDYQDGPFQFGARNQYIRYDNQYYRLNAATDVGFTTTGTDATSFVNDVTHFVLMDGDTLRQDLGSGEGFKLVGRCPHQTALRSIEPDADGQTIILQRAISGGPEINTLLTYDASDTTTEDDGCSVFVTAGGKRWKADISHGYDVFLAGYNPSADNMASAMKTCISAMVNKAIINGVAGTQGTIRMPSQTAVEALSVYKMTEEVHMPTFCTIECFGSILFDFSSDVTLNGFRINNSFPGLTWSKFSTQFYNGISSRGNKPFKAHGNRVFIKGAGKILNASGAGLILGYTSTGDRKEVAGLCIEDVTVYGFGVGHSHKTYSVYANRFINCEIFDNGYNIEVNSATRNDAGEQTTYIGCLIGDPWISHIYHNAPRFNMTFIGCHLDYTPNYVIHFGAYATRSRIHLTDCHIEGLNLLVFQVSRNTDSDAGGYLLRGDANLVVFRGNTIFATVNSTTIGSPRQLFMSGEAADGRYCFDVDMDESNELYFNNKPSKFSIMLAGPGQGVSSDSTGKNTRGRVKLSGTSRAWPYSYEQCLGGAVLFSGESGASALSDPSSGVVFETRSGTSYIKYGDAEAAYGGLIPILITLATTDTVVDLILKNIRLDIKPNEFLNATLSVCPFQSEGVIKISALIAQYDDPIYSGVVSGTNVTLTKTVATKYSTNNDAIFGYQDAMTYIGNPIVAGGASVTKSDYVGLLPVRTKPLPGANTDHLSPGLRFTGNTGTIKILLPAFWLSAA